VTAASVTLANFQTANAHRTRTAWTTDHQIATQALAHWQPDWPETTRRVAQARIDHPCLTWAETGELLGLSKGQAFSRFRKLRLAVTR